jgi:hypothetical protein
MHQQAVLQPAVQPSHIKHKSQCLPFTAYWHAGSSAVIATAAAAAAGGLQEGMLLSLT